MICVSIKPSVVDAGAPDASVLTSLTYIPGRLLGIKEPMSVVILVRMGGPPPPRRDCESEGHALDSLRGVRRAENILSEPPGAFGVVRTVWLFPAGDLPAIDLPD